MNRPRPYRRMRILLILGFITAVIYLMAGFPVLSEYFFARCITRTVSLFLNIVTNYIPISFYEWTAVFLIAGGIAVVAFIIAALVKKKYAVAVNYLYRLGVVGLSVLIAFGITYAPLYSRASSAAALGLTEPTVTKEKVYAAAEFYVDRLNEVSDKLARDSQGNVVPTHDFYALSDILNAEFDALNADFFASYKVIPKKVFFSEAMSYLGITGIYFPFYAESNVNVNIPPSELPVTMAHEMAHAKGVSRENEANLISYVLCIRADDEYLNYCGLMRAAAVMLNSLDNEQYKLLLDRLKPEILNEYRNSSLHYEKYEGFLDTVSAFFNDLFLKSNGVEVGTRSYGQTAQGLLSLYEALAE